MDVDRGLLRRAMAEASASWPGLGGSPEIFEAYVAERLVAPGDLELHGRELYLAFACSCGNALAIRILDEEYLARSERAVARVDGARAFLDEVKQALRIRLLVGPPPRIGQYAGTGPLGAWGRVTALRIALDLRRTDAGKEDGLLEAIAEPIAAEMPGTSEIERQHVQTALRAAFGPLSVRQRNVIRMHYVQALSIDEIAGLYRVHRATAARWLAGTRGQLFDDVAEQVRRNLDFTESDFKSALNRVRSQLHLSLLRLLGETGNDGMESGDEDDRCA